MCLQDKSTKFTVELQDCLDNLTAKEVKELSLSINDIQEIEKGFTTLVMLLFDKAEFNRPSIMELYSEDVSEVGSALTSLRKFQRLFNMVDLNVFDPSQIGICFNEINPAQ